jgi:hypothetical protein
VAHTAAQHRVAPDAGGRDHEPARVNAIVRRREPKRGAMAKYRKTDVSEQELEDLVRRHAEAIEDALVYLDHQRATPGGRLDVLMVDSGKSLVVAELKVVEDDGMLLQGLDYYDYVSTHREAFARLYRAHAPDPTQQVRLFLVAPSFSQTLINRCKWIDVPISLFTYSCLKFDDAAEIVPVFTEQEIPSSPEPVEAHRQDDHLAYITDAGVRTRVAALLDDVKTWKTGRLAQDALKYAISMKVDGHVFAYLHPRRKHFIISTYNAENTWTDYPVHSDDDLQKVLPLMRSAMDARTR